MYMSIHTSVDILSFGLALQTVFLSMSLVDKGHRHIDVYVYKHICKYIIFCLASNSFFVYCLLSSTSVSINVSFRLVF